MKLIVVENYEEMSKKASDFFETQIKNKPNSILGLATGGTPEGMYKELIKLNKEGLSWKDIKTFNLDEYVGISHSHKLSYHTYMDENLFNHIDIKKENINIPQGEGDVTNSGIEYDKLIEQEGGIDLQILGIGENAHIAFNEPGSLEDSGTRVVELTESTINSNMRYFDSKDDVPKTAISMGIGTLLKAHKIILLASGKNKAQAIKDTLEADISTNVPSSFLRNHKDVTIIVDKEAASLLS